MNKNKIIVTGGSGFIGSALVRHIIKNTKNIVVNVDKLTYASNNASLTSVETNSRYFFENVDICNAKEIKRIIKEQQPDIIMHLAAETHVDRSIDSPHEFIQSNIIGTYNLLEEARKYWSSLDDKKMNDFIFHHVSTDEVYGDLVETNNFFTESTPYKPNSPYSASKASADHLVRAWQNTFGLPTLITNCSNNYGPYQYPEKFIPLIIMRALEGRELPIYGDGMQIRDWLHVDDHAKALLKVVESGKINETYNIGGHNELKNIDVVKIICRYLDELKPSKYSNIEKYEQLIKHVQDRPGHDRRYAIDALKIYEHLQWKPEETFTSGIKKTIIWYLENMDWCRAVADRNYHGERLGVIEK